MFISACSINSKPGDESLTTESEYGELLSTFQEEKMEIEVSTDKNVYSKKEDEIIFKIHNTGTESVGFGVPIYVEKLKGDKWYKIPYTERLAFTDNLLEVEPKSHFEQTVELRYLDYQLTEGYYCAVKSFSVNDEDLVLGIEFELNE